jgi:hypothetical protein
MIPQALAADSARLSVTGTIVPAPCAISLSNNLIDLGTIQAASLPPMARSGKYDAARIPFQIECGQPSRVRMRFTDNQADSVPGVQQAWAGDFGLGMVAGKKIGSYSMYFEPDSLKAGTRTVWPVYEHGPDGPSGVGYNDIFSTASMGWSADHHQGAGSFERINGEIVLSYMLEQPHDLPLEREIPFNGWVTIDLEY